MEDKGDEMCSMLCRDSRALPVVLLPGNGGDVGGRASSLPPNHTPGSSNRSGSHGGLRTIAQVRELGGAPLPGPSPASRREESSIDIAERPSSMGNRPHGPGSTEPLPLPPPRANPFVGSSSEAAAGLPVDTPGAPLGMEIGTGESMRSMLSNLNDDESLLQSESEYARSDLSSVVTRVYAPSQDDSRHGSSQVLHSRIQRVGSWGATEGQVNASGG